MPIEGLFSPVTSQGNIVVDDVLASCYSHLDSHELHHLAFAPFRWMYRLLELVSPNKMQLINLIYSISQDNDGVYWYAQGLHVFSHHLFPWKLWGGYTII